MAFDRIKVQGAIAIAVLASGVGAAINGGGSGAVTLASPQVLRLLQNAPAALASYPAVALTATIRLSINGHTYSERMTGVGTRDGRTATFTLDVGKKLTLITAGGRFYGKAATSNQWLSCAAPTGGTSATPTSGTDALSFLRLLPGATGAVRVGGHDTVDGVRTTHYRVTIDLAQAVQASGDRFGGSKSDELQAISDAGVSTMPVDLWLDAQNAPRKLAFGLATAHGSSMHVAMTLRGARTLPAITAPPAAQVIPVEPCQSMFQELAYQ